MGGASAGRPPSIAGKVVGDAVVSYGFTANVRQCYHRFGGDQLNVTRIEDDTFSVPMDTRSCTVADNPAAGPTGDAGTYGQGTARPNPTWL
jgi:hypothetical protein